VNGGAGKIEIIQPFGDAFELTKKILFRPFNFEKWLIIGFAAFLAGHFAGVGFNFPFGGFPNHDTNRNVVSPDWEEWKPWLLVVIVVGGALFLIFVVVLAWLRARGNFIFTDCIVRNRAAIVEPWREYRREGNSYFLFLLLVIAGSFALLGLLGLCFFVGFGFFGHDSGNSAITPVLIVFFALILIAWICFCFFFGLTSYFMIPLMYVRRLRAIEAFGQVFRLVFEHIGPFILFCLFGICLLMGAAMIGGIATCLTCCVAALPYVGTVILLPVFVCLRAFGLFFIRQFGPDYDVWSTLPQPETPSIPPEPPPLPT